jgi:ketosteroid isomerase-like protein
MSQENVELIRRLVGYAQAGNSEGANALLSDEVELDQSRTFPDGGVYHGRAGFEAFFRQWFGTWNDLDIDAERFFDAGDQVVVFLKLSGRGKGSGAPVTLEAADVWTVKDGKAIRLVGYLDRSAALEAVALSEQDAHADS